MNSRAREEGWTDDTRIVSVISSLWRKGYDVLTKLALAIGASIVGDNGGGGGEGIGGRGSRQVEMKLFEQ